MQTVLVFLYKTGFTNYVCQCGHMLHEACLVSWARTKLADTACPLCKAPILVDDVDDGCCGFLGDPARGNAVMV